MAGKKKPAKKAAKRVGSKAAGAVDAQLKRYRSMRDFDVTAEPSGEPRGKKPTSGLPFVIQKHAASHLHYDFRLGWNGVLKSWAVAKGPSYYPGDRRLAIEVEDHPMEYGGFEGIIPQGQYGGGTVMVWDNGTWSPQPGYEDVTKALRDGGLKFVLRGKKMKGKWTLVRMGGKFADAKKPSWLLIKEHDEFERGKGDKAMTDEKPNSAVTGRTMEQIAKHKDHIWQSRGAGTQPVAKLDERLRELPKEAQPEFLPPQLALEATQPPSEDGWLHELKLDGYRIQARKDGQRVQLLTRKGLDWTHRMRAVAAEVAKLPVERATLDGEVVVLKEDGTTSFADLQAAFQDGAKRELTYFCFDLLHWNGRDTRGLPLWRRKELLAEVLAGGDEIVRLSEHIEAGGEEMFHKACELHAEGIVSKRAGSIYAAGRSGEWLKSKCLREQEFVIGGYTFSSEGEDRIGSLLLGYYRDGELVYAGRTGTGFTQKTRSDLRKRLGELEVARGAFAQVSGDGRTGAHWVQPKLVAQVRFATWTAYHLVRQAAFLGLREDKPAREVMRESPTVAPRPKGSASVRHAPPIAAKKVAVNKKPAAKTAAEHAPIRLTHPDKILDQESGLTKQQLADYYWAIADHMLPHIAERPLSLVRCPEGSSKPCFFQKHVNHMLPKGIGSVDVVDKKSGKAEPYITLKTREALAGLAQMGVLEVHPWGSRNASLEKPDRIVFDLDPDEAIEWRVLADAASEVRRRLKAIGLEGFLKTTGGKGLHIFVPIRAEHAWPLVKQFAHEFVLEMERANPALYLTKMSKAARKGKIYLDYLRNERGATSVAPFSPRARPGMPVSLPLAWSELKSEERLRFTVADFAVWKKRLAKDPWAKMEGLKQRLAFYLCHKWATKH